MKLLKTAAFMALAALAPCAFSQVTVTLPQNSGIKTLNIEYCQISDLANKKARPNIVSDSVAVVDGKATINLDQKGAARYIIPTGERDGIEFMAAPDEKFDINVASLNPLDYSIKGSEFMEGMYALESEATGIAKKYRELISAGNADENELKKLLNDYNNIFLTYFDNNTNAPAAAFALSQLEGEEFLTRYSANVANLQNSVVYPILKEKYEKESRKHDLMSGKIDAPAFTLKNLDGKDVSLADFKGKWVVLDFWGSWCIWCIKGFPALKEAYAKYDGKLEVIGIDCRESEQAWKAGVEKYKLPWVNVYCPESDVQLLDQYSVEGFPTKAIVNPEGKIVDVTTGEDPTFFTRLENFINK